MSRTVSCFVLLLSAALPGLCLAQGSNDTQIEMARIDAKTRWAFRAVSPVTIRSPIIRLGDVVKPLDPNMAGWQRLERSPIGLVPLGGKSMTIRRDRLDKAIRDAEATPTAIDWLGPSTIQVTYDPIRGDRVMQVAHATTAGAAHEPTDVDRPDRPALSPLETKRILHWIELTMKHQVPSVVETYRIEIDQRQSGIAALKSVSGVTTIEPIGKIGEGTCRFHVVARSINGPVETDIEVSLEAHPTVVVPRKSLSRGHAIQAGDLLVKPIPAEDLQSDYVVDAEATIGLEARGVLRANQPIKQSDLGWPTLIHRGDLIELRVISGGITISTNAKAIGSGAESDLIEVETLQPRRRLVARVAETGVAEIVTRAPRVSR